MARAFYQGIRYEHLQAKIWIVPIAAMAMGAGPIFLTAKAADVPGSEQVSKLPYDVKTQAVVLSGDASTMESYTRCSGLSWQSHATTVNQMKEHNLARQAGGNAPREDLDANKTLYKHR